MTTSAGMCVEPRLRAAALPPTLGASRPPDAHLTTTTTSLACLPMHMNRLQAIQSMCESPAALPGFRLTIAEVSLALLGLDRYFAPQAASRQVTLHEIRETVQWVREHFSDEHLLEDVIQSLWAPLLEAQYEARRVAKKGGRHDH
jgi:hypothetical protein